jgi:hypothetical protein
MHGLEGGTRDCLILRRRFRPHAVDPFQIGPGLEMLSFAFQHDNAKPWMRPPS